MGSTGGPGASETRRYFLTITEVMAIFRVGRTTAYALAREYIESGGNGGIPCEKVGGLLRFPTAEIERLIRRPVAFPVSDTATADPDSSVPLLGAPSHRTSDRRRTRRCPPRR